jgi:hypothetical protein
VGTAIPAYANPSSDPADRMSRALRCGGGHAIPEALIARLRLGAANHPHVPAFDKETAQASPFWVARGRPTT